MSHAAKKSDAEKTAVMLDLVHQCYESGRDDLAPPYVVIEQVSPGTGWYGGHRYADVVALSTWPSRGLRLEGFEIKASRADLKRELADPGKHRAVARFCDEWWLVIWHADMLAGLEVPADWGIMTVDDEGEDLVTVRKATKREAEPWTRHFVASLVRNAHMQSPRAEFVARAVLKANKQGRTDAEYYMGIKAREELRELGEILGFSKYVDPLVEDLVANARSMRDELAALKGERPATPKG